MNDREAGSRSAPGGGAPVARFDSIVVAQLSFIGDMVFTTPLLATLREHWPAARIGVVGQARSLEVLEDHPAVDHRLAYEKSGAGRGLRPLLAVGRRVRATRPDLFIGVTRSPRTAALARLSGASRRVGFAGAARRLAYTDTVDRPERRPFADRSLALVERLGLAAPPRPLALFVREERRRRAAERLRAAGWQGEPLLAVAPGANYATKRWTEVHVAHLLDRVLARGHLRPVLYGGPAEDALIGRLVRGRPGVLDRRSAGVRNLVSELSLCRVHLGGDSGPSHIARALGVPTVVLFGPTDPGPLDNPRPMRGLRLGLECQPCSPHGDAACPLGHHRCMTELRPDDVLAAVEAEAGLVSR